jgi:hypothetical protein
MAAWKPGFQAAIAHPSHILGNGTVPGSYLYGCLPRRSQSSLRHHGSFAALRGKHSPISSFLLTKDFESGLNREVASLQIVDNTVACHSHK